MTMTEPRILIASEYRDSEDRFEWRLVLTSNNYLQFEFKRYDAMGEVRWEPPIRERPYGEDWQASSDALALWIRQHLRKS